MKYIISLDVGTTATKGILFDEDGTQVAQMSIAYPLLQKEADQAEEDPQVIFDAVQKIIFNLSKRSSGEISAISWSAQMHSLIGLDEDRQLLTKSITWADNRSKDVVQQAKKTGLAQKIYRVTGMPPHPMAPVYKLLWIKQKNPSLFQQVKYWLGIKEYLIYRLTGKFLTETTMAAGTGLMDLNIQDWNPSLLKTVGITADQLPQIAKPTSQITHISPTYVQKLGINTQTQIVLGASDGYLSTLGVKVLTEEDFALNVGTSGAVRTISHRPCRDAKNRVFCYPVDKQNYLIGGPVNNGGIVLQWGKQMLLDPDATNQDFLDLAQTVPAGSNGLIFHPYLGGERAPLWNPNARGSFVGLTRNHSKAEIARSIIEGIIFNLFGAAHALQENTSKPQVIRVTGGFVKSDFIRQLLANVFNLPIIAMKNQESGTVAAMFIARLALGWNKSLEEISSFSTDAKMYFPQEREVAVYKQIIPVYREIERSLEQTYDKIEELQKKL